MEFSISKVLFILIFCLSFSCQESQIIKSDESQNHKDFSTFNKSLFGQSASFMFDTRKEPDDLLIEKIKSLDIPFLRFPGGTGANFYHFDGYANGFRASDIALTEGRQVHPKMIKRLEKEKKQIIGQNIDSNYVKYYVDLCLELEVKALLVVNMFCSSDEENIRLINYVRNRGVDIAGIELGNENYFKAYDRVFPDAKSYVAKCKSLTKKIKAIDPGLKVAVTAANPGFDIAPSLKLRFKKWNEVLAESSFYDAIVVHFYTKTNDCDEIAEIEERFDCAFNESLKIKDHMLKVGFEYYHSVFGEDCKFWITEYNVKNVFKHYGNTMLQAIYNGNFIIDMLQQEQIELASYHNLYSYSFGFAMLSRKGEGIVERTPFKLFQLFSKLDDSYAKINNPIVLNENLKAITYSSDTKNKKFCFVVNNSESLVELDFSSFGKDFEVSIEGFSGMDLMASMGNNAFRKADDIIDMNFYKEEQVKEKVNIPALSISVIQF